MFRLRELLLHLWEEEPISLGLVQADSKMDVGWGERLPRMVSGDGAGRVKVQEAHLVAKAKFLSLNTIDILDQVSLCRGTDLCMVGTLAASLDSATGYL